MHGLSSRGIAAITKILSIKVSVDSEHPLWVVHCNFSTSLPGNELETAPLQPRCCRVNLPGLGGCYTQRLKSLYNCSCRFTPYTKFEKCRICKQLVHQSGAHYCQGEIKYPMDLFSCVTDILAFQHLDTQ
jgi:hypothetical protein